jgi:hypothetical protein
MAKEGFKAEATFADKLRWAHQTVSIYPFWLWDRAFYDHIGELIIREAREKTDPSSAELIANLRDTEKVAGAFNCVTEWLKGAEKREEAWRLANNR